MYLARAKLGDARWERYSEQVLERHGNGRYTILLRRQPFRLGNLGAQGVSTAGLLSTGAAVGTTAAVSSLAAGTALGSFAGPIGAGVGALVGIIAGLWSAHNARAQGAKTENAAASSAIQAFDQSLQAIFAAANSGSISASDASSLCSQLYQQYWAGMAPYMVGAGRADGSGGGARCPNIQCNKSCTVGCCLGCSIVFPIVGAYAPGGAAELAFSGAGGAVTPWFTPPGTVNVPTVQGDSYGLAGRPGYSLTYTPPAGSTPSGAAGAVTSALGLSGSMIAGIPTWLLVAIGGAALVWHEM